MTDPTLEPSNTANPTQSSATPDITMRPVIEPETLAPTIPEPIVPAPTETVHTIQIDEPIAQEPKSIEELTGIQNAQPQEESPVATQTTSSGKMLKIVIPAVVAVVLGVGGYLVYSLFIAGEEPATVENTMEEQGLEEPLAEEPSTEDPLTEDPLTEDPLEQSLIEGLDSETEPVEDYSTEEDTTPKQKVPRI